MFSRVFVPLLALFFAATHVHAQAPELVSVFPAGGQQGSVVTVKLAGKNLNDVERLFFAHPGIKAVPAKGKDAGVQLTIDASCSPGDVDFWVMTKTGLSNPRRFNVGSLKEISEKEKNDTIDDAERVDFPVTINGKLDPGTDRDCYRFEFKAGQPVHCQFRSETLDGTASPSLTLFGPEGQELLHDDGRDLEPALDFSVTRTGSYVLRVEERGFQTGVNNVYRLSVFTGPRLAGRFPSVLTRGKAQSAILLGYQLPAGKPARQLAGQRSSIPASSPLLQPLTLEELTVEIRSPDTGAADGGGWLGSHAAMVEGVRYRQSDVAGSVRFALVDAPITRNDDKPHTSMATAMSVPFPAVIAGRFLTPRQIDWYRFSVKKGQTAWIEATGERDGSLMDLEIGIHDDKGKSLLSATGYNLKKGPPIPVNTLDPMVFWKAPADGDYFLAVRDLFGTTRWGHTRTYRVALGKRLEKICVTAQTTDKTPTGLAVPAGGSAKLQLVALRYNGHQEPIHIHVDKLPPGLQAPDVTLDKNKTGAAITFTAAKDAPHWVGSLAILATTKIDGKPHTFPVVGLTQNRPGTPLQMRRTQGITAAITDKPAPKNKKTKS